MNQPNDMNHLIRPLPPAAPADAVDVQPPSRPLGLLSPAGNATESKAVPRTISAQERHSRKCQVCNHPEREAIEEQFAHWERPKGIARCYEIPWVSLYRHAHAVDLFARRRANMRSILDRILERGAETKITGDTILRTLRAYSCLTEENKWVEPASHVIFSTAPLSASLPPTNVRLAALSEAAPMIDLSAKPGRLGEPLLIDTPND